MDDYSIGMLERFLTEKPHPFSTYLPMVNLHLRFAPITGLPAPYAGVVMTNLNDYEEKESRIHFLRNISQMKNNAVLMRRHEDGRLEAVFVSDDFARMMERGVEECKRLMDGTGFHHASGGPSLRAQHAQAPRDARRRQRSDDPEDHREEKAHLGQRALCVH